MGGESNKNADAASNQTGFKEGEGKDIGERYRADIGQSRTGCKGQTLRGFPLMAHNESINGNQEKSSEKWRRYAKS